MKRINTLLLLLSLLSETIAQTINIGIFYDKAVQSVSISIRNGKYHVWGNLEGYGDYRKNNIFFVSIQGNKLELRDKKNVIGTFERVEFRTTTDDGILSCRTINPISSSQDYDDGLILRAVDNKIQVINKVDMEKYIAGVIEAEGGDGAGFEYYKAQAVLVRTYTIKNMYKHGEENFNLCDQVHCQAYMGRSTKNDRIYFATKSTAGKVLIDKDSVLIMSPFHSNCGGTTSPASMVWQKDLSYLVGIKDPFCNTGKHYEWRAKIPKTEWNLFLKSNGVPKELALKDTLTKQSLRRDKYLPGTSKKITYRMIRERFHLKSAYFTVSATDHEVLFKGKGYGHGVGMCQEGAIEMARVGYTYKDIIFFYFQNVSITDYREMELDRY